MATPAESVVNAAAVAAQDAIIAAANANFILEADIVIAARAAQGKFYVKLTLNPNVSFSDIFQHYSDLGYGVKGPGCPSWGCQPAQLFGEFWEAYWSGKLICRCKCPCYAIISWK